MIDVSEGVLRKIKNPIQLPANDSNPVLNAGIYIPGAEQPTPTVYPFANYISTGSLSVRWEDYSYSLSLNVMKAAKLSIPEEVFMPESCITISAGFGISNSPITICRVYVDEVNEDADSETFSLSATGALSHILKNSYCGEMLKLSGLCHEVIAEIMDHAGVTVWDCTIGTYYWTYTFKSTDTCYSALEAVCKIFPRGGVNRDEPGFGIMETPTGLVFVGYWRDRQEQLPWGVYAFSEGRDVFTKSIKISSDTRYSKLVATGKDAGGFDLEPVIIDIPNGFGIRCPKNKIYFAEFNGNTNQENLLDWAQTILKELMNVGVTRNYSGPFRPQLTVGDVAYITDDPDSYQPPFVPTEEDIDKIYAITSITHSFGKDGFNTSFSADSGGYYAATSGWSSTLRAMGYNRHQNLVDLINKIADQVSLKNQNEYDPMRFAEETYDQTDGSAITPVPGFNEMLVTYAPWDIQQMVYGKDGEPIF